MGTTTTTTLEAPPAAAVSPGVFTADEAAAYLKLPSRRAFNARRREHGVKGRRHGNTFVYSLEQLELLRRAEFGLDGPASRRQR